MTRPARALRTYALIVAGGFSAGGLVPPVLAQAQAPQSASQPAAAQAAPFSAQINISPLRIEVDSTDTGQTVTLTNTGQRLVPIQIRLFAWSQEGGEDRYAQSSALTVSPAIFTLPAGATQVVRLLRVAPAGAKEQRYRLAVDQLPDPALARAGTAEARLRFTLPVFVDRDHAAPAQLSWRLAADRLELTNSGGQTARIANVRIAAAGGKEVAPRDSGLRYVLGGSTISFPLTGGCALGATAVNAVVDGVQANVRIAQPCG